MKSYIFAAISLSRSQAFENLTFNDYMIDAGSGSRIRPRNSGADSAAFLNRKIFDSAHPRLSRLKGTKPLANNNLIKGGTASTPSHFSFSD